MSSGKPKRRHPGKAILSGGIAGGLEICITYPTEYVKTQMQLYENVARAGAMKCFTGTIESHGPLALYRGLSCLLFFSIPKVAARFWAFESGKNFLQDTNGKMTNSNLLLCGLFSGVTEAVLVVTPMETLKVKLIHDQLTRSKAERHYRGFFHGVYTIIRNDGIRAAYRGCGPTVLKQGSNQMLRWFIYKRMKEWIAGPDGDPDKLSSLNTFFVGAFAGACSVYGNTPVDVIKTRMQGLEAHKYRNAIDCAKKLLKHEGPLAFYKGVTPRLIKVSADVGIVFVLYEQVNKLLDKIWVTDDY